MTVVCEHPQVLLVVDDEEGMRVTLADILQDLDLAVEVACDGREAVDMVRAGDYALALMDIRMPVMNGVLALKEIKRLRPDMPVIMMTAFADQESLTESKRVGAEAILGKPLDLGCLIRLVNGALARQRCADE
jgi:two-component system response regulator (stage 0 sporulation protein F)